MKNTVFTDLRNGQSHVASVDEINLIRVKSFYGEGTKENPSRFIFQYWNHDGELVFTVDPIKNSLDYCADLD